MCTGQWETCAGWLRPHTQARLSTTLWKPQSSVWLKRTELFSFSPTDVQILIGTRFPSTSSAATTSRSVQYHTRRSLTEIRKVPAYQQTSFPYPNLVSRWLALEWRTTQAASPTRSSCKTLSVVVTPNQVSPLSWITMLRCWKTPSCRISHP